jgi:tetratricopeptide (TPR) repeat protein
VFDLDFDNLPKTLKQIDPSDIRVLLAGIVLLLVPIIFIVYRIGSGKSGDAGFAGSSTRERLESVGRKGFSFVAREEKSHGGVGGSSLYRAPKADAQWSSAIEAISRAPVELPPTPGLSPEGRMMLEADMDPEMRHGNMLLENGQIEEAILAFKNILGRDTPNLFMKFYASSNLCQAYEKAGRKAELEVEFRRMVALMATLPDFGFKADLGPGLKALSQLHGQFGKMRSDGKLRAYADSVLKTRTGGKVNFDAVFSELEQQVGEIPGLSAFNQ